jgi:hypothetical protein
MRKERSSSDVKKRGIKAGLHQALNDYLKVDRNRMGTSTLGEHVSEEKKEQALRYNYIKTLPYCL